MRSSSLMISHADPGYIFLSIRVKSWPLSKLLRLLLRSNPLFLSRIYTQIMGGCMLVKNSNTFAKNMAFCISILYHIPLNKMASLKERT